MRDLARSHGAKGPVGVSVGAAGGRVDAYSWVEPLNRLATLLFQRGWYEESARVCRAILTERPWHFGALSGIVMCYRNLGENDKAYRVWALRCIPRLDPVDSYRRRDWVKRNVEDAKSCSVTNNNTNHQNLCDNTRFFYAIRLICSI